MSLSVANQKGVGGPGVEVFENVERHGDRNFKSTTLHAGPPISKKSKKSNFSVFFASSVSMKVEKVEKVEKLGVRGPHGFG